MRSKSHESFKKSTLVIHAVVKSITSRDSKTEQENRIERDFFANFEIITKFKGAITKKDVTIYIGLQNIYGKRYFEPTMFNSQAMYNVQVGDEYLLELIKKNQQYEPINHRSSILKIVRKIAQEEYIDNSGQLSFRYVSKEPHLNYLGKEISLSEYNKHRNINLKL